MTSSLAVLASAALAVLGGQLSAQAATAVTAAPAATPSDGKISFERSCSAPKSGEFSCFALRRTDIKQAKGMLATAASSPSGYGPTDLLSAYGLPSDGGAGQTIAIVDAFDDPTAEKDLGVYRAQYGLSACTSDNGCFSKVDERGGTTYPEPDPGGWDHETSLDLDMVSAVAPNAHILLVEGDSAGFDDLGNAVDEAVALGAKYVSNSYGSLYDSGPGSGEDPSDLALDAYYDHPGVAVVASSGDSSYGVAFPADSPDVTAVGGTSLVRDPSTSRGWTESVWNRRGGPGSGCSIYQPKPAFQTDTGCDHRTVADVSAIADPDPGVAVYDQGGWAVFGGTSVSAPIITGVYADAGTPAAGTYPNSYAYGLGGAGLHDVTTGSNGSCSPAYLCAAGTGYDGPTGLGTPDGLLAFSAGRRGTFTGTVTDAATGQPVSGAVVTASDGGSAHTDAKGTYSLSVPVGTYDLTVDEYGYATGTATAESVAEGQKSTEDFTLTPVPSRTVSGKATDDSGHGWPLYAKITVDGAPGGPVWTDPHTGAYTLALPLGHTYTIHVDSAYPGYKEETKKVTVGDAAQTVDFPVQADPWAGTAPGYSLHLTGTTEKFDSTESAPPGWKVVNADGTTGGWSFDDPGSRGNTTGGDGVFAIVDSDHYGNGATQNSQLITPAYDFTGDTDPEVSFDTDYKASGTQHADVDATTDGGATWIPVWSNTAEISGPGKVELPLTAFAGKPQVQLRFRYRGAYDWWWSVDDIFVGQRGLTATPGGLIAGTITDANTSAGVNGATVASQDQPALSTVTTATADDPALGDGFYSLFSSDVGKHSFIASKQTYTSLAKALTVTTDSETDGDFTLKAGRLTTRTASISASVGSRGSTTRAVTVKNTGGATATLTLGEQTGGFTADSTAQSDAAAPLLRIKGSYSAHFIGTPAQPSAAPPASAPSGAAWQSAADLPTTLMDNVADSYGGKIYTAFGNDATGAVSDLYSLDPAAGTWTKLAGAGAPKQAPAHGFINGRWYITGGWSADDEPDPALDIYDPATNSWSTGAPDPNPHAGSGTAVLDGKLYVVGGCADYWCGMSDVMVYDPATGTWSQAADYPEPISWESCGAVDGELYCAGGQTDASEVKHAYAYDPASDKWSAIPDMPEPLWASAYTAANGSLLISSGITKDALTNQGYAFDPRIGSWTALPNANTASYRGASAPGFYKIGGADGFTLPPSTISTVQLLPGYAQGQSADVSWLSENRQQLTLRPGQSRTVTVTLDAAASGVTGPGDLTAALWFRTDTPYTPPTIPVTLHVGPPKSWSRISGTVRGTTGSHSPSSVPGSTIRLQTQAGKQYTLTTGADGRYSQWLDVGDGPLTASASASGFASATYSVRVRKGAEVVRSFTLKKR